MPLAHCPFCGSEEIKKELSKREFALSLLFFGFPLVRTKIYRCFDCGKLFDETGKERKYN